MNERKKETRRHSRGRIILIMIGMALISICRAVAQEMDNPRSGNLTVGGTVRDDAGEPLPGVTVQVMPKIENGDDRDYHAIVNRGTATDIDGRYSIEIAPDDTLVFSYVGMETRRIPVKGRNTIDVTLAIAGEWIDETVVIGYGSAAKRDLTGSITTIKGEQIADLPAMNPMSSLQGKVAGMQVVNGGQPGADPEIRIRGTNSINGYKPLYIVDGILNDNINYLNPQDIESIEVLKDPSSLAIFGVRGANGAIVVITKQAQTDRTRVSINTSFGWKHVPDRISVTDAAQFKELYNEQLSNEGQAPFDYTGWTADTDWQNRIFQNAFITNNNMSIQGASGRHTFYFGVGYSYEGGNIRHEKYNRWTVNASDDFGITDYARVGFRFNAARIKPADTKGVADAVRATPIAPVYNKEYGLYTALPAFQKAQLLNPMVNVDLMAGTNKALNYRIGGNLYGEVDFLDHFQLRVAYMMDYASNEGNSYTPIIRVYDTEAEDNVTTLGTGKTAVGQFKETETKVQGDYLLTYKNSFGDHNLTATMGFTTYYNSFSRIEGGRSQGVGLVIPDNPDKWYLSIGDAATATNGSSQWERATASFLARVIYNYQGKYLLNASFRRDGSSAFSYTGNEWQSFYAIGAGWLISEEKFMKGIDWVDMLKLKGSWGTLGNQNMGTAYPAEPLLTNAYSAVFGTPSQIYPGYQLAFLPNSNLHWEKTHAWEIGMETYLLRNRLHFEGVFYKKNTKDLLAQVPGLSGTVPGIGNLGEIENRGFELSAMWRDQVGSWGYSVGANLTTVRNRVKSLVQDGYAIVAGDKSQSYTDAGHPIGYFYGYKVEGVYQSEADIAASPVNRLAIVTPGDLKFADMNGDGEVTPSDRTLIGNPMPDVTYGFNFGLSYKGWELNLDFMGQGGNQIYRSWDNYRYAQFNYLTERLGRWHGEGTSNSQPLLNAAHAINYENSDYYIENGSFFRLRNIQLGYNFDHQLIKRLGMQSLKLYFNAQNVKTWKHNTGYTPEIGGTAVAFGIDNGTYPVPAVYTFGANVVF